jgi:hypothetical protein
VVWNPDLAEKAAVTASNTPAPSPAPNVGDAGSAAVGSGSSTLAN